MTVNIRHRGRRWSEDFPKNSYELLDLADKLRNDYPFSVKIENMFELDYVYNEFQISSLDDLVRLNLFAERFSEMYEEDEAIMFALMTQNPNAGISELLEMTYGLSSVTAYPCCNDEELTELAFNNEWLTEFDDCPYEVLEYLDTDKVAAEVHRQREGYMYGSFYVEPDGYISPEKEIELPKPETGFFRLLLAADRENRVPDRASSEWLTLPCSKADLEVFEKRLGCPMNKMICITARSALPKLHPVTIQRSEIPVLNELALKLSELSRDEVVKLKAVMELEDVKSIEQTAQLIPHLTEYEFDPLSMDASIYGKAYLFNNLPIGFNTEIFASVDMEEFGRSILGAKGGGMTSYGAVSGRSQSLFTPISKGSDEDETEEFEDDESEDEEEGLEACLT